MAARTKPSANISMSRRIAYLEKVLKVLNNNIKILRNALSVAETGQEEMRKEWIKEKERGTFLLHELNDAQVRVHKLQSLVDVSKTFSKANLKRQIRLAVIEESAAKAKKRKNNG